MSKEFGRSSTPSTKQQVEELADSKRSALLRWVERLALYIERPFNWPGNASLNIFYHTDTLSVFLWLIVALTGLYLTLFYQFGFDAGYNSVAKMESQFIARIVRAIHRYASGSAMVVTVLHGIRLFFMGRFRGARWLAWVSGVVMAVLLWVDGVTGYWLVWDQRAQLINNSFITLLGRVSQSAPAFASGLLIANKTDRSWIFITILLVIHILLFGGAALFYWWHIMRLQRPKFLPERYWLIGTGAVLIIISAIFPVGMLPKADFGQLPGLVSLDPFYLLVIPFVTGPTAGWVWGGLGILSLLAGIVPWMSFSKPPAPIQIHPQSCTGCTLCSKDCPYKAISMQPRPPGEAHKLIAQVDPKLCVACGVCLGSCETNAISLNELSGTAIWQNVETRLARHPEQSVTLCFTCERHAVQGARPYLDQQPSNTQAVEIIPLPCVAVIPPGLVARAVSSGAAEVRVVGCPPDDCSRREGNLWTDARMSRARLPRLKKAYENAPIYTFWLPPDAFAQALPVIPSESTRSEAKIEDNRPGASYTPILTWRNFALAFGALAILMAMQVWITQAWSPRVYPVTKSYVQLVVPDPMLLAFPADRFSEKYGEQPTHLILRDGEVTLFDKPYPFTEVDNTDPLVVEFPTSLGDHNLTLSMVSDSKNSNTLMIYNRTVTLTSGQVWIIMYDSLPRPK